MDENKRNTYTVLEKETFFFFHLVMCKGEIECKITHAKQGQPENSLARNSRLNPPISIN